MKRTTMTVKELLDREIIGKDHWLSKAKVSNEDIDIVDGVVVWRDGTWHGGKWHGGIRYT